MEIETKRLYEIEVEVNADSRLSCHRLYVRLDSINEKMIMKKIKPVIIKRLKDNKTPCKNPLIDITTIVVFNTLSIFNGVSNLPFYDHTGAIIE